MVVSYQDIKYREIHDGCHIAVIVLAVMAASAGTETGLLSRLLGVLCVSAPMLVAALIIPGAFGGGDIKLMAAAGLFLGWKSTIVSAVLAVFAAGVYGVLLIARKKEYRGRRFAFGPYLSAGMAAGALWGEKLWQMWYGW